MQELKLYSNLECRIDGNLITSRMAADYEKQIRHSLESFDQGSEEKGLAEYLSDDFLHQKILFARIQIEIISAEIFAVLTLSLKEALTDPELRVLIQDCKKMYGEKWGRSFGEQRIPIPNSHKLLQVQFGTPYTDFYQKRQKYFEIESIAELDEKISDSVNLSYLAFQNINFDHLKKDISAKIFSHCLFLGCNIRSLSTEQFGEHCHIYQQPNFPFNPFVAKLYSKDDLFDGYLAGIPESYEQSLDKKIYKHYIINGKEAENIEETLFRRLHDHSITDALNDFLEVFDEKRIVAIMGGHSLARGHKDYIKVAEISKRLTEQSYLMISGGGPGAMEATHLGAWLAGKPESALMQCIDILSAAPHYSDIYWLDKAFEVLALYPSSDYESLGVPTWLYGHEPPTPFASKIAKYFANSVREEGLLAIAKGGVIFSPGSAGTIQEIFQDATQNHYLSYTFASPMVFLNQAYWTRERPVFPLLKKMAEEGKYQNMILSTHDEVADVVAEIQKFTNA